MPRHWTGRPVSGTSIGDVAMNQTSPNPCLRGTDPLGREQRRNELRKICHVFDGC